MKITVSTGGKKLYSSEIRARVIAMKKNNSFFEQTTKLIKICDIP